MTEVHEADNEAKDKAREAKL